MTPVNSIEISVVIPLFNKERYIQACIKSVLAQNFTPMELIVVDDGSIDSGAELVSNFNDPRIRLIRQENKGVSAARNAGVAASTYDLVAFLDADDEWLPGHLQTLNKLATEYSNVGFWSTGFHFMSNSQMRTHSIRTPSAVFSTKTYLSALLDGKHLVHTSASMVRKARYYEAGGFMQGFNHGEDHALWLALVLDGGVAVSSSVTAVYNRDVSSGLTQRLVTGLDACTVIIDRLLETRSDLDITVREMLRELRCQKALTYAITAILHGNRRVARAFVDRAKHTKKFAMRRKQLQLLLLLNGNLLTHAAKSIIAVKRRLARISL